jgi:hypothetical protein
MKEPEMRQIAAWMDAAVCAPSDAGLHARIAGEVRECDCRDPNVRMLSLGCHRLSALQKRIAAKGHHDAHLRIPSWQQGLP